MGDSGTDRSQSTGRRLEHDGLGLQEGLDFGPAAGHGPADGAAAVDHADKYVYAAANDGMLHAFYAGVVTVTACVTTIDATGGQEAWASRDMPSAAVRKSLQRSVRTPV